MSLDGLRKWYNKLRKGQRGALQASSVSPPGTHSLSGSHGWREVFAAGVHEFADPGQYGLPPSAAAPRPLAIMQTDIPSISRDGPATAVALRCEGFDAHTTHSSPALQGG